MKKTWFSSKRLNLSFTMAILLCLTFVLLFPVVWMITSSLKGSNYYLDAYSLIPKTIDLEAYKYWLTVPASNYWLAIRNTLLSFLVTTALTIPFGTMAGYAIARWRTRWIDVFLMAMFFLQMMPGFVSLGPLFREFIELKLIGNPLALYIVYTAFNLPLVLLTMRNYFMTIPTEIEEAAQVDGCSRWGILWKVTFPLARPAMITSTIFIFMGIWLEYLLANILMRGKYVTLAVILINYSKTDNEWRPDLLMSMGVLIMIPLTLLFPLVRKYLVGGLNSGAIKG
jgi:ABC-type glycerol-3-phosphate transport system permease component